MRLHHLPRLLSLLSSVAVAVAAADDGNKESSCTVHDGDTYYDLTPLQASTDYKFEDDGQEFFINVCQPVHEELWHIDVERPDNVGAFIRNFARRGDTSIGEVNTTLTVRDGHPLLLLTGGSLCPGTDDMRAMTAIRFICDTSVFGSGSGTPFLVAQLPPDDNSACAFFIEWRTHYACPAGDRTGIWGALVVVLSIIAIILMMLYIVGGTLYRRYVLDLRGFDQVPRFSIFSLGDTIEFVQNTCERFLPTSRASGYPNGYGYNHHHTSVRPRRRSRGEVDRLPTLPEEEEALVGGGHEEQGYGHESLAPPQSIQQAQPEAKPIPGSAEGGPNQATEGEPQPPNVTEGAIRL